MTATPDPDPAILTQADAIAILRRIAKRIGSDCEAGGLESTATGLGDLWPDIKAATCWKPAPQLFPKEYASNDPHAKSPLRVEDSNFQPTSLWFGLMGGSGCLGPSEVAALHADLGTWLAARTKPEPEPKEDAWRNLEK